MRLRQLSVFSILPIAPQLANLVMPLTPPWDDMRVKHEWNTVPSNWESLGPPPFNTTIDLHFALKPHHETALIDALYEVSTPGSPKYVFSNASHARCTHFVPLFRHRYGAHLSKAQVSQLVEPSPDTLELVNSWLEHHRVPTSSISITHGGGWLTVTGVLVSQANEMLGASYQVYRQSGMNGTMILRTVGYALPTVLHSHVNTVIPTTYFGSTDALRRTPRRHVVGADTPSKRQLSSRKDDDDDNDDDDDDEIFPSMLRSLYRTAAYVPAATDKNRLGVAGLVKNHPDKKDLKLFMEFCRKDAIDATFNVVELNGVVHNPRRPSDEANQNIQYSQAIAYPTPQTFYSIGGDISILPGSNLPAADDLDQVFLNYLLNEESVPQTISISYGNQEKNLPFAYADAICNLYARLGARGVTVLVPSGNEGVGPEPDDEDFEDCIADKETGRIQFITDFPASCMCIALLPLPLGEAYRAFASTGF